MLILQSYQQKRAILKSSPTPMTTHGRQLIWKIQCTKYWPRTIQVMEKRTAFLIKKSTLPEDVDKQL
jgi:hypothetical protein